MRQRVVTDALRLVGSIAGKSRRSIRRLLGRWFMTALVRAHSESAPIPTSLEYSALDEKFNLT